MKLLSIKIYKKNVSPFLLSGLCSSLSALLVLLPISVIFAPQSVQADKNVDYRAVPPFTSTYVKPNVLFILDNSNSMDEDVDGAAVGGAAANSKSEIARRAIETIIDNNQQTMRFGMMAYQQTGVGLRQIHNSPYYNDYDPAHYDPVATPTPKDPTTNSKRSTNPDDPGNFIYFDTALPFYSGGNQGSAYCYSYDFSYADPETCTATSSGSCHRYWCFNSKTGTLATPIGATFTELTNIYGYGGYFANWRLVPTDSDVAAGFHEFGLELSWKHVSATWFSNSSPGPGRLHSEITDSSTGHINDLKGLLATSQFTSSTDIPLRNAGLTPLAGTVESAREYFNGTLPSSEAAGGVNRTSPVQYECQKNFVILVTDGLPSTDKTGHVGNTDDLITELEAEITSLRTTPVPSFTNDFDIQTYVVGFAIPEQFGDKLNALAVAGGTDVNGEAMLADDADELAAQLEAVFLQISRQVSSGAAASVISNTRSGQGVVYQSIFYPEYSDTTPQRNSVDWVGSIQALFVDDYGNLREDTNHNYRLDTGNERCQAFVPPIPSWCDNGTIDSEDDDGDGHLDNDEDQQDIAGHPGWKGNGALDSEDVDRDGHLDNDEDHQNITGYSHWDGNGHLDTEDNDNDGHLDMEEDDQDIAGHADWKGNHILDTEDQDGDGHLDVMEDGNGDGFYQTEDLDDDCNLDVNEDIDNDGRLDYDEDVDGDGHLDIDEDQQLIPDYPAWQGNGVLDTEDVDGDDTLDSINEDLLIIVDHGSWNGNNQLDTEDIDRDGNLDVDEDNVDHGIPGWIGNNILDTEDTNGNGTLDTEDLDCDGILDREDLDNDNHLDPDEDAFDHGPLFAAWLNNNNFDTEDTNGNGVIDGPEIDIDNDNVIDSEDLDGDGNFDSIDEDQVDHGIPGWIGNGTLDTEDSNNNGVIDTEDLDGDCVLDREDNDNDGTLDPTNEDTIGEVTGLPNGILDTEDLDNDDNLDINEDNDNDFVLDTEDIAYMPDQPYGDDHLDIHEDLDNDNNLDNDEDIDGDGRLDRDDEDSFSVAGYPLWQNNGSLNSEDVDGDCKGDLNEDTNGNGVIDTEDTDGDGVLDSSEDLNGNGVFDKEDLDGDGFLDITNEDNDNDGILDTEDVDLDNHLDINEDINNNGFLDYERDFNGDGFLDNSDLIITFTFDVDGNTVVYKYFDENGNGLMDIEDEVTFDPPIPSWTNNGVLDTEDANLNGDLDAGEDKNLNGILDSEDLNGNGILDNERLAGSWPIQQVDYLWHSSTWLNEMNDADVVSQRLYHWPNQQRHILTFIDSDNDQVVDSGELIDFADTNWNPLYHYLNLYPTFGDEPAWTQDIRNDGNWSNFIENQSQRVINFIRGKEQADFTSTTTPSYTLPQMRSRVVDYDDDGVAEVWRLGDVIYSSPTQVGRPAEGYHLLYRDASYGEFAALYQNRRQVLYVGANDGMMHAFNGGFYNDLIKGVSEQSQAMPDFYSDVNDNSQWDVGEPLIRDYNGNGVYDDGKGNETIHTIGSELWAYIPYNLLPHLYWLTEDSYQHVYYMDLKPRIFDAKIFFQADNVTPLDADHPNGWGTVMVVGMRFGGGEIKVDFLKDGDSYNEAVDGDRTMKSAYVIFDITNPEVAPKVLAELTFDGQGYTTCYPTVIPMNPKNENRWTLVFGSGPNESGMPGISSSLDDAVSDTPGRLYMVDLQKLVAGKEIWSVLGTAGQSLSPGSHTAASFDTNTFVSDIIAVDYDLDYYADALYFGTVSGDETNGWGGKLRRTELFESPNTAHWQNSVLMDPSTVTGINQPITAAPAIGIDNKGKKWVFFGTGRFFTNSDISNVDLQSYYGVKEEFSLVARADLQDITDAKVFYDESITGLTGISDYTALENAIELQSGWRLDLLDEFGAAIGHRNLGQAALLGEILSFTTYLPSDDICETEGTSDLFAVFYKTGTAYHKPVIGATWTDDGDLIVEEGELEIKRSGSIGKGLASSPSLHVGREEGARVFIQTSKGGISIFQEDSPGLTKSIKSYWKQR